ncbi:ABC transporter permease [Paenibacillus agaridevorans]|nr:ABC transporter permease subunit [Paenibacillus agaridevorans]
MKTEALAWKQIKSSGYLYLIFLVPLVYFLIFKYGPMFGILIAFKDYNVFQGVLNSEWAGWKHFESFIFDPYFWKLVRNTLLLNIYMIIFYFPAPILLALLLNEIRFKAFKRVVQSISYLPHFLSTVVVAGMLVNFLATDGLINQIIASLGFNKIQFLMLPEWFRTIYISSDIWQKIGWGSIIYLAALSGVDPHLYEAAKMDGANRFKQAIHVTLPGISSVIMILFLLTLGDLMSIGFEKILLLYTGPTYETADVISTFVYRRGLLGADFSYGAAVGLFQSVISFLLIVGANYAARKLNATSLW